MTGDYFCNLYSSCRPAVVSHGAVLVPVVEADEVVLGELDVAECGRLLCPPVHHVCQAVPEAGHLQRTGLRVVRKLPQVHLALGSDGQPLRVGHPAVRSYPADRTIWRGGWMTEEVSPDEPVGDGHSVEVGVLAVHEVSVRSPDPAEKLPVQHLTIL